MLDAFSLMSAIANKLEDSVQVQCVSDKGSWRCQELTDGSISREFYDIQRIAEGGGRRAEIPSGAGSPKSTLITAAGPAGIASTKSDEGGMVVTNAAYDEGLDGQETRVVVTIASQFIEDRKDCRLSSINGTEKNVLSLGESHLFDFVSQYLACWEKSLMGTCG